jgi:Icc-related predicted phosphoesterase
MKIVTISDTHDKHDEIEIPDGDLLLFAGDCTRRGSFNEVKDFVEWYGKHPHAYKIMVAGNHDFGFQNNPSKFEQLCIDNNIIYLNNTNVIVMGIKIHGSPSTPAFCDWAFNRSRTIEESMSKHSQLLGHYYIGNDWDKIPEDTDILITHGPAYGILDRTYRGDLTGCECLLKHIIDKTNIKMHVFGHIHESRGVIVKNTTTFVNTSSLNSRYLPQKDGTFVFDWEHVQYGISYGRD